MTEALDWCVVVWDFAAAPAAAGSINWSTAAVALISGLIGISGSWLALGWQARRESRSVRAAILAEVEALLELAARKHYVGQFSKVLNNLALDEQHGLRRTYSVRLGIPEHYNRVFQANAPKLGVLTEKNARHVVRFYQLMDSLRAETSEGGRLHEGTSDSEPFESAAHILNETLRTGKFLAIW